MRFAITRVVQATVVAAMLETIAAVANSKSFHPISVGMYAVIELIYFFVVVCIAAVIATRISSVVIWTQKIVFFGITVTPSILSYLIFFRGVSSYQESGSVLVKDHQITSTGIESLALNIGISAVTALIATAIYFRQNSRSS